MSLSMRACAAVIGVGVLALTGCSSDAGAATAAGADASPADITLSYSQPHTDPFQNAEMEGSMEKFKQLGYKTLPATNSDRNASQQITDIQTLINTGAKGLMVSVGDADAIVPAIESANDSKVPIVAIDEAPASGKIAMIVRADNVKMGELACQEMGKRVQSGTSVITLDGDPVTSNGRDRTSGFNDCMAKNFPGVKLVNIATGWDPAKAAAGIETAMNQYKDVSGIYNQSDATFFPTVLDTLNTLGKLKPAGQDGHVVQVSVDASPMAMKAIRDGYLDAAVAQPMTDYIDYGVDYLTRAIKGETFKAGATDHNSTIVQKGDNLVDLLPTPVVTKDNVEDPDLWGNKPFAIQAFGATS